MGLKVKIQKNKKKLEKTPYFIKGRIKEFQREVDKEREQGNYKV